MKIIIPDNLEQIKENIDLFDGVILSIKNYSVNVRYQIELNELSSIIDMLSDKEVFISVNKNIANNELDSLENLLLELNKYRIKGVLYSDVSIVTFKDRLNYDLVWAQEHLTTNYETINYWHTHGVNYTYLSSDITLKEINEISFNTSVKLMANIFGYIPIFTSKRHIVKNYLKTFNINDNSDVYYLEKEGNIYPIFDKMCTYVFSNKVLNGLNEYYNMGVDYLVFNGLLISNDKFHDVLKIASGITRENIYSSYKQINNIIKNTSSLFLYQETVSRVKK